MAKRPSKKTMSTNGSMALMMVPDNELVNYEGLFDPEMSAGAEGSGGLAPFISTEDGVLKLKDNVIGKELDAVILGVAVEHALYPGRYQKGKPNNPICFYVGSDEENAAPHATSPARQSEHCGTCIKNAFGSGQGNAKACRQSRRLLIMPLGPNDNPEDAQLYRLRVPPTSIKHLASYAALLKSYKRPIQTLVTHIEVSGHETNRFEIKYKPARPLDRDVLAVLARRATEGKESLFALPMLSAEKPAAGKAGSRALVKGGRRVVRR